MLYSLTMAQDVSPVEIVNQELSRFMSNFYRDRFRFCIRWLFILILVNFVLAGVVFYLFTVLPKAPSKFYASNMYNGVITKMHPLSAPVVEPKKLLSWSGQIVTNSFTFNFANYRDNFNEIKSSYTNSGWQSYRTMLDTSGILNTVVNNNLFATATIIGNPKLLDDGVRDGHYAWTVRVPLLLTFKTNVAGGQQTQAFPQKKITVDAIIDRIPNLDNPEEIAISNISVL